MLLLTSVYCNLASINVLFAQLWQTGRMSHLAHQRVRRRGFRRDERGATAVEFALVAPLLCFMLLSIVEIGMLAMMSSALDNSVIDPQLHIEHRAACAIGWGARWGGKRAHRLFRGGRDQTAGGSALGSGDEERCRRSDSLHQSSHDEGLGG